MCGITGIVDLRHSRVIDEALLRRMNSTQFHRGPDGEGYHFEPGVGFAHRRLSIIDLEGGKQPLYNEDHSVVVTYNGEIYNFQELQKQLEARGHIFRTHCDTEVIVHAWEEWGEDCVTRFNGMFAFAVWDRNTQTFFLARDRIGIKPMYYTNEIDGFVAFGSEMKSVLAWSKLPRSIDPQAVEEYFTFGYVPEPRSILHGVAKLEPGTTLTLQRGRPGGQPRQYWDVKFDQARTASRSETEEELLLRLKQSVDRRLISEVPLGAFLSGGVDSSAVVAMMSDLSSSPVNTCSISFGDPEFNESRYAQIVSDRYRTAHRVRQVEPNDYSLINDLIGFYDEPFADSSAIPTYRVCELAREQVTVALSGDGGDENFAGYRRYRWHEYEERVRRFLPAWIRRAVFGFGGRVYPKLDWAPRFLRAKSTLEALGRDSLEGYLHSVSIFPRAQRQRLFSETFRRQLAGYDSREVFLRHAKGFTGNDSVSLVQYLDFKTYLPGDILTKVDRASMAHSLEVRVPLLDHTFVEWVATIGIDQKLSNGEGKHIFKTALKDHLSEDILYRDKMGFGVPISKWFRKELKDRVREEILDGVLGDSNIFEMTQLRKLVDDHQAGRREYSPVLWALLMFSGFYRQCIDG